MITKYYIDVVHQKLKHLFIDNVRELVNTIEIALNKIFLQMTDDKVSKKL